MNLGTYDINIDFSKLFVHNNTSIYFKEGDLNTAKVRARLTMKNKPINIAGCNVTIRIEPSEGNTITDNATVIDPLNGIIEIDLKSNALLEGTHLFEVWIIKDDSVKKSGKIGYRVLDSIDDAGAIEGTNEYPILISLISDTNKAIQDAKEVLNIAKDMEANVNEAIGNTNVAISNAETATSNANSKITELDDAKTSMITKVDASIDTMKTDVNKAKEDMKLTTDAKVKEIDIAITNMNSSVEDAKTDMQATTDAKMQQVDNSIANMKVETNTAIDNMVSKTDEKITDVNRALAAGTKDLEVKEARKDANGVVHDTLEQRLKSDLIVGDKSLKDFVVDMNGMKETQDLAYETNTGYKVCNDTQVGAVKDLKLCGKSLVNIADFSKVVVQGGATKGTNGKINFPVNNASFYYEGDMFGQLCTAIFIPENNEKYTIHTIGKDTVNRDAWFNQVGIQVKVLNNSEIYKVRCYSNSTIANSIQCYIVRGDVSQNPPQYFEGIASVGNETPLEVLTRKEDGNLFDGKSFINAYVGGSDGSSFVTPANSLSLIIPCLPNTTYYGGYESGGDRTVFATFDKYPTNQSKCLNKTGTGTIITPPNAKYLVYYCCSSNTIPPIKPFINTNNKGWSENKQDKKPILFKDADGNWKPVTELRGIDLNSCDIIDDKVNKFYKKYNEKIFNGSDSENWVMDTISDTKVNRFNISISDLSFPNANLICDKFKVNNAHVLDTEHIGHDTKGRIALFIDKSKANDVNGLKNYLKVNPFVLQYTIKDILIYDTNPLELESFDNITLWLILSGVIAPPASFKTTSSLPNFIKSIQEQVRQLQDQVYKTNVANFTVALNTLDTKLRLDRLEAPQQ